MAEAGNQRDEDMFAVGNVIMNRLRQGGGTLKNVILSPAQFSPWNTTKLPDGSLLYAAGKDQGRDMGAIKPSSKAYEIADLLLSGEVEDITGGATHFFNPNISSPKWAEGMSNKTKIGSHVFGRAGNFPSGLSSAGKPLSAIPEVGGGSLLKERNMVMDPNAPQRTGLLGMFDRMRQVDPETGLTGFERFGAALDPLLMPQQRMGEQIRARGAQRMATQSRNRTIDTLKKRAQAGDTLAAMVLQGLESGAYDAKTAMSLYMGKMLETEKDDRTTQIKNYEYWISKGKSEEEAEALAKSGQTIQNVIGGPAGAEDKFYEEKYKNLGRTFAEIQQKAGQAGANNLTINALKQLYQVAPSGPIQGRLAELFPEANDISAAVQSLRTQLAPQLRVEGSGSTSDIEYAGMLNSLGSLKNSPEANAALLDLMLVKNEILQKKSEIAIRVGMPEEEGGLTIQQAERAMLDIDRQMWSENAMVTSIKQLIENAGGFTASSDGNTITTSSGLTVQFE